MREWLFPNKLSLTLSTCFTIYTNSLSHLQMSRVSLWALLLNMGNLTSRKYWFDWLIPIYPIYFTIGKKIVINRTEEQSRASQSTCQLYFCLCACALFSVFVLFWFGQVRRWHYYRLQLTRHLTRQNLNL